MPHFHEDVVSALETPNCVRSLYNVDKLKNMPPKAYKCLAP